MILAIISSLAVITPALDGLSLAATLVGVWLLGVAAANLLILGLFLAISISSQIHSAPLLVELTKLVAYMAILLVSRYAINLTLSARRARDHPNSLDRLDWVCATDLGGNSDRTGPEAVRR